MSLKNIPLVSAALNSNNCNICSLTNVRSSSLEVRKVLSFCDVTKRVMYIAPPTIAEYLITWIKEMNCFNS